jgi:HD-GYP domain-containing protein (c-di-GMP phosphodiesterase class II)
MPPMRRSGSDGRLVTITTWALLVAVVGGLAAALSVGERERDIVGTTSTLFWVFTPVGILGVLAADWMLRAGGDDDRAELAILGGTLWAFSILRAVHSFDAADVVRDANPATTTAAFLSLPVAAAALFPLWAAPTPWARAVARRRRPWVGFWTIGATGVAAWMFAAPDSAFAVPTDVWARRIATAFAMLACLGVAVRFLRRHLLSRDRAMLGLSLAVAALAVGGLEWLPDAAGSRGWWLAHFVGALGVLALAPCAWWALRPDEATRGLVAPLARRDPLAAAELTESPAVRYVVRAAERSSISLDHAARVAEVALRAAEHARVSRSRLVTHATAALLHDLGTAAAPGARAGNGTVAPSATPSSPGSPGSPDDAVAVAVRGGDLLARRRETAPAARVVRAQRERVDGRGGPDGLADLEIPAEARLLAICDAYDALAFGSAEGSDTGGVGDGRAREVLREFAGSHFDDVLVELVCVVLDAGGAVEPAAPERGGGRACAHALAAEARSLAAGAPTS